MIAYIHSGMVSVMSLGQYRPTFYPGPVEQFFGVYAGRINDQSDLGVVWKARVVREVVDNGRPGSVAL